MANLRAFTSPRPRRLLIIEDANNSGGMAELLDYTDVDIQRVNDTASGLAALRATAFDCVAVDLLPDGQGFELLAEMQRNPELRSVPIVAACPADLPHDEEEYLRSLGKSLVLKYARSPERLLDDTALFLHYPISQLVPAKQQMLKSLNESDEALIGKKILVVDDDVRNIFAISSILERHHMQVLTANNGRDAIGQIERTEDLALVLMDIMMPEMDGYTTMRQIRAQAKFQILPIIALTAKAMKGDREKCLEAGASDYISKPVSNQQLVALLRTWLHR
ncbi:MAG: response regulator [Cellvibrionaceae bacterium]|nr:response regulator [Cellvibrionaceae bacterium]